MSLGIFLHPTISCSFLFIYFLSQFGQCGARAVLLRGRMHVEHHAAMQRHNSIKTNSQEKGTKTRYICTHKHTHICEQIAMPEQQQAKTNKKKHKTSATDRFSRWLTAAAAPVYFPAASLKCPRECLCGIISYSRIK